MKRMLHGFFLCLCILTATSLTAEKPSSSPFLESGIPTPGSITVDPSGNSHTSYRFQVSGEDMVLSIKVSGANADLDIYVQASEPFTTYDYAEAYANTTDYNEEVQLSRLTSPSLYNGTYYIDVVYPYQFFPESGENIPFTLTVTAKEPAVAAVLEEGVAQEGTLHPEQGMTSIYAVDVPENTEILRVDILDSLADIDLVIGFDSPAVTWDNALESSTEYLTTESLLLSPKKGNYLSPGRYYIAVFDQIAYEHSEEFTLMARFDPSPPDSPFSPLDFGDLSDPMNRTRLAVVELATSVNGGSGSIVSKEGYILTNWHVIKEDSGLPAQSIYVNMSLSPQRPPVELFLAEPVFFDPQLDLALLKIVSTRYGEDLPEDLSLPFIELSDAPLLLGEPLQVWGYPSIGGTGSRVTITLTRGYLCGFDPAGAYHLLKTDCEINSGNSGGAALDYQFHLVGVPTSIRSENGGQLGYIHPIEMIPASWYEYFSYEE